MITDAIHGASVHTSLLFCDVSGRITTALDLTQACRDLERNLQGGRILHTVCQQLGNWFFSLHCCYTLLLWTAKPSTACSCAAREYCKFPALFTLFWLGRSQNRPVFAPGARKPSAALSHSSTYIHPFLHFIFTFVFLNTCGGVYVHWIIISNVVDAHAMDSGGHTCNGQ